MSNPVDLVVERAGARVGSTLGEKYTLQALVGVGGTAAVYEATHRNGHRVAIKMLHLELALDNGIRSRFLSEGYAANNIEHPGIVRVLDDDTAQDGSTYLVMELLDGQTLDERAAALGGRLPVVEVLAIVDGLLDVLTVAHDRGIVHRDIKPENVFLTAEGGVKVLDFGIARMNVPAAAHATMTGQVFGTPAFLPPEQALGETKQIDHRTDLWAVGATMFTLLTGQFVYGEGPPAMLIALAASATPRPLNAVDASIPRAVAQVVDRALARDRSQRWSSARQMQEALRLAAQGGDFCTPQDAQPSAEGPHSSSTELRRSIVLGAIAFCVVGSVLSLAVLMVWLLRGEGSKAVSAELPSAEPPAALLTASAAPAAPPDVTTPQPAASTSAPQPTASVPLVPRRTPRRAPKPTTGAFDYQ